MKTITSIRLIVALGGLYLFGSATSFAQEFDTDDFPDTSEVAPELPAEPDEAFALPALFAPSAFTPNGDGLNDVFLVAAPDLHSPLLTIYNRQGQLLFSGPATRGGWDGRYNGGLAPPGNYVWAVSYTDRSGTAQRELGTVALLP